MILRRLGNKQKIAKEIQKHFPPHKIYIEPFFGAGGMFFNKPKAKYNIVNDLDSDVFNLFDVLMNKKTELEKAFKIMPIHSDLLDYWKNNEETEPIKKALRFLLLSNFMPTGHQGTIDLNAENPKNHFFNKIDECFDFMFNVKFSNMDCNKFIDVTSKRSKDKVKDVLIYCDPPYLGTNDNYSNSFTDEQNNDLFDALEKSKCNFALSEFDHPFVLEQAKERNLNVIVIGERHNLKNKRTEILVTNYENRQPLLFT